MGNKYEWTIEQLRREPKSDRRTAPGLSVDDLRAARMERLGAADEILQRAEAADRALLASEQRAFDSAVAEADELRGMLDRLDEARRGAAVLPPHQLGGPSGGSHDRELRTLGTALFSSGAAIVPDQMAREVWAHLAASTVLLKAGARVIETDRSNLLIPRLAADSTASWTAEGSEIAESSPTFSGVDAVLRKCAIVTRVSNELVADANPDVVSLLMEQITRSLSLALDLAGVEGTGIANEPRGMSLTAGITTVTDLGPDGSVPDNLDEIATAIAALEAANATASAILMHPTIWSVYSRIKTDSAATRNEPLIGHGNVADAAARRLFGVPVYLSSQLSRTEVRGSSGAVCSSIYVCDMSQVVLVRRGDIRLELDRSRLFNSDESEVRGILRATWAFPNPTAIARIVGVKVS